MGEGGGWGAGDEDGGSEITLDIPARIFSTATRLRCIAAVCFEHNSSVRPSRQRFVSVRTRTLGDKQPPAAHMQSQRDRAMPSASASHMKAGR